MLNPDLAEVSTKIARLEISSPSTTTFSESTIKTTNYQSMYFTIFERELRTNLMDTIGEKYGNIELTIIYDRYKANVGLSIRLPLKSMFCGPCRRNKKIDKPVVKV
jgi:hypothetical protein